MVLDQCVKGTFYNVRLTHVLRTVNVRCSFLLCTFLLFFLISFFYFFPTLVLHSCFLCHFSYDRFSYLAS